MAGVSSCLHCGAALPGDGLTGICPACLLERGLEKPSLLTPGARLGKYEIHSLVGAGGLGEVYRAHDARLGRDVALKVLREELFSDPDRSSRFEHEARAASALNHPNIIHIYDIDTTTVPPYIVMELVEGKTLRESLPLALPIAKVLAFATQIASGLANAHESGIVHRDLKPENVMVTNDGIIKIVDFGLAKRVRGADASDSSTTLGRTQPGVILGTVGYMSPEQASGHSLDHRADQFSLGTILYEMATGRRAFDRATAAQIMAAIIERQPEPMTSLRSGLPERFVAIVERCLAKAPGARYESTRRIVAELESIGDLSSESEPTRSSRTMRSLAVLPLVNLNADPAREYFADGMTEAIIAQLAKLRSLKVISRTSVMRFKDSSQALPDIARSLNVQAIVEGSVLWVGDRIRITVELVDGTTDENLWADSYDRDLSDVLSLQSDVARAVVKEIKLAVTPQERARLATPSPVHPKAQLAYLKGRHHWNKRTKKGLKKSVALLQEAIDIDPTYALAHAGLADAYNMLGNFAVLPPRDAFPLAKWAASRALEVDANLGEAYASLGAAKSGFDWDFVEAEKDFRKAIALNPGYATARQWFAEVLAALGQFEESIAEIEKAQELDPLSLVIRATTGWVYYLARRYERAVTECQRALELDPNFPLAYLYLGLAFEEQSRHEEARVHMERALALSGGDRDIAAFLGRTYALSGNDAKAREIRDGLLVELRQRYVTPFAMAVIQMGLEEIDNAFEWLEKAFQERSDALVFLQVHPIFDSLRADSRFQELARRIGFPAV